MSKDFEISVRVDTFNVVREVELLSIEGKELIIKCKFLISIEILLESGQAFLVKELTFYLREVENLL